MKSHKFMHCGWEPDESGDTYAREGEQKSIITISFADALGYPDEELACIVHRHVGPLDERDPTVIGKLVWADQIVDSLNFVELQRSLLGPS